ncbi:MAG: metalloregulator ArsR/SmtB family transcription factor [Nanoarchaeota archaeon]|nr:metalloregulator ArsR/SmtB family transcription factor [Nanoarchaeota archaeon]
MKQSSNNKNNKYNVFFTNLANSLKIDIILSLRQKDKNVGEISNELGVEQSKVSHALASLKLCNIVSVKQNGKERIYSLNKKTILPMLNLIDKHAKDYCKCKCCAEKCGSKK